MPVRKIITFKAKKKAKVKYHLVIENFNDYDFETKEVRAASAEEAAKKTVVGYLGETFNDDEFTASAQNGRYASEAYTIGIGTTKETAALQFVQSKMEFN